MENKKIKNATSIVFEGIQFRSKLEARVYKHLLNKGFKPNYEPEAIELLGSFTPSNPWYSDGEPQVTIKGKPKIERSWKYTPDFIIDLNNIVIILECKGYSNDLHPYKRKMFLAQLESTCDEAGVKFYYFEVHNIKGLKKSIDVINKLKEEHNEEPI